MDPLDSLLNGDYPLHDNPKHPLPKPAYRRDGLYGATPFSPKPTIIVALTTEQRCKWCGSTNMGFGGLFTEQEGRGLLGPTAFRNSIPHAPKDKIEKVYHTVEEVPYCPSCLGKGDIIIGASNDHQTPTERSEVCHSQSEGGSEPGE